MHSETKSGRGSAAGNQATLELAKSLLDSVERGDVETMTTFFAPGATIWHNFDEVDGTVEQTAGFLRAVLTKVTRVRYEERRCSVTQSGFVHQHLFTAQRNDDGVRVRIPACLIASIEDGKITRVEEYMDSAHLAELTKFLR
jgi:ketosteroid isomerase-like protein